MIDWAKSEQFKPYVCAVIKEVRSQGMAQNPTFSDIIWKQFHLPLLILVFSFNLYIEKKQNQWQFKNIKVKVWAKLWLVKLFLS